MAEEIVRDLNNPFADVWKALDAKEQRKAMRGAMRKEANNIKKAAQDAMSASGVGLGRKSDLRKSIYARVYPNKYGLGFMASVTPHGKRGIHTNRYGKEKPVAMWLESGVPEKQSVRRVGKRIHGWRTITRTGRKGRAYERSGHSTGKVKGYGFMAKAESQTASGVEDRLFDTLENNINKAARKHGLL